jgi:hypothetical protein
MEQRLDQVELVKVSGVFHCSLLLVPRLMSVARGLNPGSKKLERCGNAQCVRMVLVLHINIRCMLPGM